MSTSSLRVYRHSGKFVAYAPLLPVLATLLLGMQFGLGYAHLMMWIPLIFLKMILTGLYGLFFGWVTLQLLKVGKVRNTAIATLSGATVGLMALYFEWSGTISVVFPHTPLPWSPSAIFSGMQQLYRDNYWSLANGAHVYGVFLVLIWAVEAFIIVGLCVYIPYRRISSTPFCEESSVWLDQTEIFYIPGTFTDPAQIAALKAGDVMLLTEAKPKDKGDDRFTRFVLKHSPRCPLFSTLRLQSVTLTQNVRGEYQEKRSSLTGDLILSPEMLELIDKLAAGDADGADVTPDADPKG